MSPEGILVTIKICNMHGILVHNSNQMHKSQSLFYLTTALHVSGVTIAYLQGQKTTVTTESGNHYTVKDRVNPYPVNVENMVSS
jgi:hypothetical protein